MSQRVERINNSLAILVYSMCILNSMTAFWEYSTCLVKFWGWPECFAYVLKIFEVHSKCRNIKVYSTAAWLNFNCFYSILTAFQTFWSHSSENLKQHCWKVGRYQGVIGSSSDGFLQFQFPQNFNQFLKTRWILDRVL